MTTYYNTLQDLIADNPATVRVTFGSPKSLHYWQYGFYAQDDWRVNRSLLINVGLRYEYFTPVTGMLNVSTSNPFGPFNSIGQPMFAPNHNDWGPRLGFAWNPLGTQRLVVRAGAGLTYMPPQPMLCYDFAAINAQLPFSANITPADVPPGFNLSFPFPQTQFVQQAIANPGIVNTLGIVLGRQRGRLSLQGRRRGAVELQRAIAVNQKQFAAGFLCRKSRLSPVYSRISESVLARGSATAGAKRRSGGFRV